MDSQPVNDYICNDSSLNIKDHRKHDKPFFAVRSRDVNLSSALGMKETDTKNSMEISRPTTATATINAVRASTSHIQMHERRTLRNQGT
jgi:hypothetical protein